MSAETDVRADDPRMEQNNDPEYRAKGRKALRAAIGGFFVDMYDVYLPVIDRFITFGGAAYNTGNPYARPLTSSTANTLLRDADPAVYYALEFFAQVIRTHIGTRLLAEATAAEGYIVAAVGEEPGQR